MIAKEWLTAVDVAHMASISYGMARKVMKGIGTTEVSGSDVISRKQFGLWVESISVPTKAHPEGVEPIVLPIRRNGLAEIGQVYFAHSPEIGRVKIGFSGNVEHRMHHLSETCPAPLRLLGSVEGCRSTERHFHAKFATFRTHREWFRDDRELLRQISRVLFKQSLGVLEYFTEGK